MKKLIVMPLLAALMVLSGCYSTGIDYSRSLFSYIPDDPELLVLVKPNDLTKIAEMAIKEMPIEEMLNTGFEIDPTQVAHYKKVAIQLFDSLGIPWENVESVGVLVYFGKPIFLVSGSFTKEGVEGKMTEIGFKKDGEHFDYIYDKQKLMIPADGVMMMAEAEQLDDLIMVPEEKRLWNKEDFKKYRTSSPLDNSLFIWSKVPDNLLSDFQYRDALGDVSLAINFANNLTIKATAIVTDPQKTVIFHDFVLGTVKIGSAFFGDDPDYSPVLRGIKVTQDNRTVEASLVLSGERMLALKERIVDDINNPNSKTLQKFQNAISKFR